MNTDSSNLMDDGELSPFEQAVNASSANVRIVMILVFIISDTNFLCFRNCFDLCREFYRQYGLSTEVIPVTTEEYGLSKAARPENSRLDKSKLTACGFALLPPWQDAVKRFLEEAQL